MSDRRFDPPSDRVEHWRGWLAGNRLARWNEVRSKYSNRALRLEEAALVLAMWERDDPQKFRLAIGRIGD